MSNEELIHESVPNGCSRSYLDTKTVEHLRKELEGNENCCLNFPIYSVTLEYFSPTNPIVLNYFDDTHKQPSWCEHIGNVQAVCLNTLYLETDPSTRIPDPTYSWRTIKINFKTPAPINNGQKPIFRAGDLYNALEQFDEKLFVVTRNIGSEEITTNTLCTITVLPSYYDGYPFNYFYSEDEQYINGMEVVDHTKVDFNYSSLSDNYYYDGLDSLNYMIYTNVPASHAKERRERFARKYREFEEECKQYKRESKKSEEQQTN